MSSRWISPEVIDAVDMKFSQLAMDNPDTDPDLLWSVAKRFVRAECAADTSMFLQKMGFYDKAANDIGGSGLE